MKFDLVLKITAPTNPGLAFFENMPNTLIPGHSRMIHGNKSIANPQARVSYNQEKNFKNAIHALIHAGVR